MGRTLIVRVGQKPEPKKTFYFGLRTSDSDEQLLIRCVLCLQTAMSQVEKKVGLLRRSSSSKKPLKEKVVLMYDEIFAVGLLLVLCGVAAGRRRRSRRRRSRRNNNNLLSGPPQKEDPSKHNPRFWDELFLMKVRRASGQHTSGASSVLLGSSHFHSRNNVETRLTFPRVTNAA